MMHRTDQIILFGYLAIILIVGLAAARRKLSLLDFLVAGRSMKWLPVGLSVMVASFSAINFTAFSGEVMCNGLYVLMALPCFLLVIWPVTRIILPFYFRRQPVSAYEFLGAKFDLRVRRLASCLFILWRTVWMATALYAGALFLGGAMNLNAYFLIVLAGAIGTAYTMAGGIRSVIWTDMAQFAVLFGSLTAAVLVAAGTMGGFAGVLREADAVGILRPFHPFDARAFSLDPRVRITLWSALIGTLVAFLTRYGADQMVVQRYFVARSLADARRGFLLNIACAVFALLCLAFLGLAVRAALAASPTGGFDALKPVQVLSRFTASMPYGSLLVAGLLASTMSSIDSGLHSCCTAFVIDFLLPSSTPPPAATIGRASPVAAARWLTLALGAAVTVVACFIGNLGSIFEIANKVINGLGSPLLVLVLLGIYGRRVTARGMFAGGIAGTLLSIALTVCARRLALHYYAVVNFIGTAALCYAFSLFLPPPARKETPTCPT